MSCRATASGRRAPVFLSAAAVRQHSPDDLNKSAWVLGFGLQTPAARPRVVVGSGLG